MESKLLDSVNTVQTPEGVDIHLKVAGIWPRSVAWIIDLLIRGALYALLGVLAGLLGDFGTGLMLISFFLMEWFYPVLFEVLNRGMTPGKKYLNIQVLNSDGTPVGWSPSLLRNILRTVDFLMNDRFQRLGDLAADTIVVYYNNSSALASIPEKSAIKPAFDLNLKEQQAIIRYAERSKQLSDARLNELAEILDSLDAAEHNMTRDKLLGIANGLAGRK